MAKSIAKQLFNIQPASPQVRKKPTAGIIPFYKMFTDSGVGNPPPPASWLTRK